MSVFPFFEWMQNLAVSESIRQSLWQYAVIQSLHLVALAMFAGAVLIVDLRLLGGGLKKQPVAEVAKDAQPWLITGFIGLILTGVPQLVSSALKQYDSPLFWIKMEVLLVALIFTFTVRRKVALADEERVGPFWGKLVGLTSIALWAGVAIPARLIGLLS